MMLAAMISSKPGLERTIALALVSLAALFAVGLFGAQLSAPNRFGCFLSGQDFASMYINSKLILAGQGDIVYEPARLAEARDDVLNGSDTVCVNAWPTEYWRAFLLPLFPLTLFPPRVAYYLWTALSLVLVFFTLWRLARAIGVHPAPLWLIAIAFFPLTGGLFQGQVHTWQFLALTEFWLALRARAEHRAGLWLSVQLVKPQFVPLLFLYLAWHRRWRALGWFMAAGLVWLGLSLFLAGGVDGITAYVNMMLTRTPPDAPIGAEGMLSWRSLALLIFGAGRLDLVSVFTAVLTLATTALVVWSWYRQSDAASELLPQPFLLIIAATLLVGYHSHPYTAVLLIAPAVCLLVHVTGMPGIVARFWSALLDFMFLSPSLLTILTFVIWGVGVTEGITKVLNPNLIQLLTLTVILLVGVLVPMRQEWAEPGKGKLTTKAPLGSTV